jgi:hypothetical protein
LHYLRDKLNIKTTSKTMQAINKNLCNNDRECNNMYLCKVSDSNVFYVLRKK